jgi:hypothetical protein
MIPLSTNSKIRKFCYRAIPKHLIRNFTLSYLTLALIFPAPRFFAVVLVIQTFKPVSLSQTL